MLGLVVLLFGGGPIAAANAAAKPAAPACHGTPALLIVSAYPAEMGKIIKATKLDTVQPVRSAPPDSKEYWTGTLEGRRVIETLAGIGPVNATDTTKDAFTLLGGCIAGVVFSGVAGSPAPWRSARPRTHSVSLPVSPIPRSSRA
jgi:hypothetical protein